MLSWIYLLYILYSYVTAVMPQSGEKTKLIASISIYSSLLRTTHWQCWMLSRHGAVFVLPNSFSCHRPLFVCCIVAFEVEPFFLVWSEMKAHRGVDRRVPPPCTAMSAHQGKGRRSKINQLFLFSNLTVRPRTEFVNRVNHFASDLIC